ncbi:hypothetical protein FNQ90_09480 [Streptomyces alkaliphilus]|uniref:Acyl-CoA dehydrogenase/oxidase N-terminal domain-containing protein n=1 Tax=Streptomyces alkaliphilus TaxID=1472722 RepID=A0A7W3Y1J3_9ACTN|nr:acyl-CoA dehydrogenase family protein [Streptomyces alkaliphilus]MBB0244330.1 hypothetical protein [Streptomyces alkaliphilus]
MSTNDELVTLLDAVRDIVPTLRKNGLEAEKRRRIPEENIELLEKAGVFRMAVPRRLGGLDLGVAEQSKVISEIARGWPSTGWLTMVWVTSARAAGLYSDRAREEAFGSWKSSIMAA